MHHSTEVANRRSKIGHAQKHAADQSKSRRRKHEERAIAVRPGQSGRKADTRARTPVGTKPFRLQCRSVRCAGLMRDDRCAEPRTASSPKARAAAARCGRIERGGRAHGCGRAASSTSNPMTAAPARTRRPQRHARAHGKPKCGSVNSVRTAQHPAAVHHARAHSTAALRARKRTAESTRPID